METQTQSLSEKHEQENGYNSMRWDSEIQYHIKLDLTFTNYGQDMTMALYTVLNSVNDNRVDSTGLLHNSFLALLLMKTIEYHLVRHMMTFLLLVHHTDLVLLEIRGMYLLPSLKIYQPLLHSRQTDFVITNVSWLWKSVWKSSFPSLIPCRFYVEPTLLSEEKSDFINSVTGWLDRYK